MLKILIIVAIIAVIIAAIVWRIRASRSLGQANAAAREAAIAEYMRVNYVGIQTVQYTPEQAREGAIRALIANGTITA